MFRGTRCWTFVNRRKFFRYSLITTAGIGLSGINLRFNKVAGNQTIHDPFNVRKKRQLNYSDKYNISSNLEPKLLHRFVVIGDPHYGELSRSSSNIIGLDNRTGPAVEPIDYDETAQDMVDALITEKNSGGLDFFIINGDVQRRENIG